MNTQSHLHHRRPAPRPSALARCLTPVLVVTLLAGCAALQPVRQVERRPLRVHDLFSHNAVLQRNRPLAVWGEATPGQTVSVTVGEASAAAKADKSGHWRLTLDAQPAGGPYVMRISDTATNLSLTNVLIGDVWVCGGQSNMQWPVSRANDADDEIAAAGNAAIRLFTVRRRAALEPQPWLQGEAWEVCSPQTVKDFSAVGYFFGREIQKTQQVPVGLISCNWGGTPAEAWTSEQMLTTDPWFADHVASFKESIETYPAELAEFETKQSVLNEEYTKAFTEWRANARAVDVGMKEHWYAVDHDDSDWAAFRMPGTWSGAVGGRIRTLTWVRRDVDLPGDRAGKGLLLKLTGIDDVDVTFFNGIEVGKTDENTPRHWAVPRQYTIPGSLVKAGRNVIAVRVMDFGTSGGFRGKESDMALIVGNETPPIALAGIWKMKVSHWTPQDDMPKRPSKPSNPEGPNSPSTLLNGMLSSLIPYGIEGAIWYQGESNAHSAFHYRRLFPMMIKDWRARWEQGDFPFIWVQLANYMSPPEEPGDSAWAELRESQTMALALPNTAMAVAIDVGEANSIHPGDKQTVGQRLAVAARNVAYGEDIVHSGPLYDIMTVEGDKIRISFTHTGKGLVARDGNLKQFAIAGADRRFVWADAKIDGGTVIVWNDAVKSPVAVRYAWSDNPEGCNLYNAEGLPASPFRTDDWPGITDPRYGDTP